MKGRSTLVVLFLAVLALLISGCVQITEEYWINNDGSGKIHVEVGVSEALMLVGGSNFDSSQVFREQGLDAQNSDLKNVVTNVTTENGMRIIRLDASVPNLQKFYTGIAADPQSSLQAKFEKLPNGDYLLTRTLGAGFIDSSSYSSLFKNAIADALTAVLLKDKFWTVRMHSDMIVNTNGTWDQANKVVEWKVPMSDVLGGKSQTLTAEFKPPFPLALVIGIGAGVVVLIGLGVGAWLLLRKRSRPRLPTEPDMDAPEV